MSKKKIIIIAAAAVLVIGAALAAFFLLGGDGEEKEEEASVPEVYSVFGREYPALTTEKAPEVHQGQEEAEDTAEEPPKEEQKEEQEGKEEAQMPLPVTYQYQGIQDPKTAARAYAVRLTDEFGYITVDEKMRKADLPAVLEDQGEIYLAYKLEQPKELIQVQISWDAASCTVKFATVEGEIRPEVRLMSSMEAMDYINSLPPEKLGLTGKSMDEYNVYALDGGVLVDDKPCIRINIYRTLENTNTNEIAGCYFLSSIEKRIYRLDPDTGDIEELDDADSAPAVQAGAK